MSGVQCCTQLVGIEDRVYMQVGDLDRCLAIADEDLDRADEDKTSAVHFLRFELTPEQVAALQGGAPLAAGIDHDNYRVEISPLPKIFGNLCSPTSTKKCTNRLIELESAVLLGNL